MKQSLTYRLTRDDGRVIKLHRYFGRSVRLKKTEYKTLRSLLSYLPYQALYDYKFFLYDLHPDIFLVIYTSDCNCIRLINGSPANYVLKNLQTFITPDGLALRLPLNPDYLPF